MRKDGRAAKVDNAKLWLPEDMVILFAWYLKFYESVGDSLIADHPDWCLVGLDRALVVRRLRAVNSSVMDWQEAGDVVAMHWRDKEASDLIDRLYRIRKAQLRGGIA